MTKHNLSSERRAELAKQRRAKVQAQRNALNREMSSARKSAGLTYHVTGNRDSQAEQGWQRQIEIMPRDTRSTTAAIFGDPIPGDPRCPWRPVSRSIQREG